MIKLYGVSISNNVAKVRYCLSYLNLPYDLIETSPIKGETQTDSFRQISPSGKVPAIDVDGFTLFESNAINRYLAAIQQAPIYPMDAKKRAKIDAWMDYVSIHVGAAQGRVTFNRALAPILGMPSDEAAIKEALELLGKYLPIIDAQLSINKYLAGSEFSLADIDLLAVLDPSELSDINLQPYSNIVKWRNQLKAEPFYQNIYKDFTEHVKGAIGSLIA